MASEDPIEATAALIAEVAPDQGTVVQAPVVGGEVTAQAGDSQATIPVDPDAPITLEATESPENVEVPALEVALPAELDVQAGQVADDGTIVYPADDGASAAVQALDDGAVRIQTVIPDQSAQHEFTYTFDGLTPVLRDDGGADLVADAGDGVATTVGSIDPAWAVDANGVSVPTEYAVNDAGALVQTVTPGPDTTYPIVADPKISGTCGILFCTVRFDRATTRNIADYTNLGGIVSGIAAVMGSVPAGILAGALAIDGWIAGRYYGNGNCLGIKYQRNTFLVVGPVQVQRGTYNCR